MTRVLLIGGYGVFGQLLAQMLVEQGDYKLIIAGRDEIKAQQLCARLGASATALGIDINGPELPERLAQTRADLVIHCAGPFQGQSYLVAEACIAEKIPYTDLSDGREFVQGFGALDNAAKVAGIFCLTGASTTPALTGAVIDHLAQGLTDIDHLEIGITPGNRAPRGRAVMRAILSYCGEPVMQVKAGGDVALTGWGKLHRAAVPGLGKRWFSPCDGPDMVTLPKIYPRVDIIFRAGLELSVLHLGLYGLARLRALRLLPNLARLTVPLHKMASLLEGFGTDRGGMYVLVRGVTAGADGVHKPVTRRWSLVAQGGDGPNIPVMAAAAIARKVHENQPPAPGAHACYGVLALSDFEYFFRQYHITSQIDDGESR